MSNLNEKGLYSFRIEVCGGIASGKTTLARLLDNSGLKPILENFQINPFLEAFYLDPNLYAFETEITFLLQHYNQVKVNRFEPKTLICDFSFYLDLAYSYITLADDKFRAFRTVYSEVRRDISSPDLLIYLQCSATTELKRILSRNRNFERSIRVEFLEELHRSLLRRIEEEARPETKIIEIDSDRLDFANDVIVQQEVIKLIHNQIDK